MGGFSYADTLDSAKGWAGTIRFNDNLLQQFQAFYQRHDTFSLGICNGCQLMALLGWVPAASASGSGAPLPDLQQPRFVHNASGRFESRWVRGRPPPCPAPCWAPRLLRCSARRPAPVLTPSCAPALPPPAQVMVEIDEASPAVMLKGMGGMKAGIWCAHGEGQALFPNEQVKTHVLSNHLAPVRYIDQDGNTTEQYPFNPNGSPLGIAGMCSQDGRHLAMMPHPERCYLGWQLPWAPKEAGIDPKGPAPWLKLFQNAREWCEAQQQ